MRKTLALFITATIGMYSTIYSCDEFYFSPTPFNLSSVELPLPALEPRNQLSQENNRILLDVYNQFPNLQRNLVLGSNPLNEYIILILNSSYGTYGLDALSKIIASLQEIGLSGRIVYHFSTDGKSDDLFEIEGSAALGQMFLQIILSKNTYKYWIPVVKSRDGLGTNLCIELGNSNSLRKPKRK